ncbi:chromate resistance protein ChrB domain-containing protein [Methylocystis sp.]|uniref:chromate resistance protein ChrB domain-containing protein n=1 Tax=Methylocystis sp. TaxID=1911079 RepID=UPI003DA51076
MSPGRNRTGRSCQRLICRRATHWGAPYGSRARPKVDRIACPWLIRRFVDHELGCWSLWAFYRRVCGALGHPTWRAARFHTAGEICNLLYAAGLEVVEARGVVHYPPCGVAAKLFAPLDLWLGRSTALGPAFIAVSATKPPKTNTGDQ